MPHPETWPAAVRTPLALAYRAVAGGRNWLYDAGVLRTARATIPVVGVGNISFGGTGKTPAVLWLARALTAAGRRVTVVSRGYGGLRAADPLLVAEGGSLAADPLAAGDEAYLVATENAAHAVVVGRDRRAAVAFAARRGAEIALLDDGFQHRRLARQADVVLVDARGDETLLREPARGLRRAAVVLVTHALPGLRVPRLLEPHEWPPLVARGLRGSVAPPAVAAAWHRPVAVQFPAGDMRPPESLAGRLVLAVSGIARPERFEEALRGIGAIVAGHVAFPDHHPFDHNDAARIARRARESGAEYVVTTAKDAVRWPPEAPAPAVLRIAFDVPAEAEVLRIVMERL